MPVLTLGTGVFYTDDLRIEVVAPGGAELDEVKAAVGTEFQVHGAFEGHVVAESIHLRDVVPGVEMNGDDPVARPFVDEERMVELLRQFVLRFEVRIKVINRTGHRGASTAGVDRGKFRGACRVFPAGTGSLPGSYKRRLVAGGCD